eukprot:PLAT1633.2.p1 GENE.PLAT1633.2~~PLAT1633.2.p1  ORF type:complete len:353 (+),score=107.52 PLAT1633.2:1-1059(+)
MRSEAGRLAAALPPAERAARLSRLRAAARRRARRADGAASRMRPPASGIPPSTCELALQAEQGVPSQAAMWARSAGERFAADAARQQWTLALQPHRRRFETVSDCRARLLRWQRGWLLRCVPRLVAENLALLHSRLHAYYLHVAALKRLPATALPLRAGLAAEVDAAAALGIPAPSLKALMADRAVKAVEATAKQQPNRVMLPAFFSKSASLTPLLRMLPSSACVDLVDAHARFAVLTRRMQPRSVSSGEFLSLAAVVQRVLYHLSCADGTVTLPKSEETHVLLPRPAGFKLWAKLRSTAHLVLPDQLSEDDSLLLRQSARELQRQWLALPIEEKEAIATGLQAWPQHGMAD